METSAAQNAHRPVRSPPSASSASSRKVDGYRRPLPKPLQPSARPSGSSGWSRKVDSYAGSPPKPPSAQCVRPHPARPDGLFAARLIATPPAAHDPYSSSAFAPIRLVRREPQGLIATPLAAHGPHSPVRCPIRLVRMEPQKLDSYRRPLPKSPIAQCARSPIRLVRMEPKVDSYAGSLPKSPIARVRSPPSGSSGWSARLIATPARRPSPLSPSACAPIRLVRMERKVDSYAGAPPKSPIAQCVRPHPARPDGAQG